MDEDNGTIKKKSDGTEYTETNSGHSSPTHSSLNTTKMPTIHDGAPKVGDDMGGATKTVMADDGMAKPSNEINDVNKAAMTNDTPENAPEQKKKFSIPVLRTFESDRMRIAQTKGGAELRSVLAREMEKKREAQQEYKKNVKDLMKESLILREKKQNFFKRQREKIRGDDKEEKNSSARADAPDSEHGNKSASGITKYMMGIAGKNSQDKLPHTEREIDATADENIAGAESVTMGHSSNEMDNPERQPFGVSMVRPNEIQHPDTADGISNPMASIPAETEAIGADKGKKLTILERIRGKKNPDEEFTKQEREAMKQQQEEIVEKESMRGRWKEFEEKKDRLRAQGIQARDIRSYNVNQEKPPVMQRKNMFAIVLIFIMLISLAAIVIFVATRPNEGPPVISDTELKPPPNVVNNEHRVLVDISTSPEDWENISRNKGSQNIITQYIPYEINEEKSEQINLREFSAFFGLNLPDGLLETLDDYYFAGNYITNTNPNGLFILQVKNYNDALVWMLNWEKNAINAFHRVFPNTVRRSQPGNTSIERKIIDNKDIRILKNQESEYRLMYYFFNRSTLVFIVGNENVIPYINARIRSANAG